MLEDVVRVCRAVWVRVFGTLGVQCRFVRSSNIPEPWREASKQGEYKTNLGVVTVEHSDVEFLGKVLAEIRIITVVVADEVGGS